MPMLFNRVAALVFTLGLISLPMRGVDAAAITPSSALIHPGDKLQVVVYNHPELSQVVTVDARRQVNLTMAGAVDARGADDMLLSRRIAARLGRFIPRVAVDVQTISTDQSILIAGGSIGSLPYISGETLSQAIAQLQSAAVTITTDSKTAQAASSERDLFRGRLDPHRVTVTRDDRTLGTFDVAALNDNGSSGIALEPGDVIGLRHKPVRVAVIGDVAEPGVAYLNADESLGDAITQAGGVTQDSATHVLLTRNGQSDDLPLGAPALAAPAHVGDVLAVLRAPHITVAGAVDKPGEVTLHGDSSLLSAIYGAGGPTKAANLKNVSILHNGSRTSFDIKSTVHGNGNTNPVLADGDTVFVPSADKADYNGVFSALGAAGSLIYAFK